MTNKLSEFRKELEEYQRENGINERSWTNARDRAIQRVYNLSEIKRYLFGGKNVYFQLDSEYVSGSTKFREVWRATSTG